MQTFRPTWHGKDAVSPFSSWCPFTQLLSWLILVSCHNSCMTCLNCACKSPSAPLVCRNRHDYDPYCSFFTTAWLSQKVASLPLIIPAYCAIRVSKRTITIWPWSSASTGPHPLISLPSPAWASGKINYRLMIQCWWLVVLFKQYGVKSVLCALIFSYCCHTSCCEAGNTMASSC